MLPQPAIGVLTGWPAEAYTHSVVIGVDPAADALALPASRGVVVMLGGEEVKNTDLKVSGTGTVSRSVFMAATGDCRSLTRRKLAPAERGVRAGADLRSIVREVRAVACGSAFEADLVYLLLAKALMPHAAKLVAERWRSWWAQIDAHAEFPEWSKTDLAVGSVAQRSTSTAKGMVQDAAEKEGCILGPFADKDSAGRFIERVVDAFDLCREHRLLVLAPRAQACAYKEMRRCAAPCDGSETMASYRSRVASAVQAVTGGGLAALLSVEEAAMRAAASEQDFESAARHRAQADRLKKLGGPSGQRVGRLEDFRFLIVWRSVKEGWARVACCERGFVRWLADVNVKNGGEAAEDAAAELWRVASTWAQGVAQEIMGRNEVDVLGLLARERTCPDTRRTAWFVPLKHAEDAGEAARAVLRAAAAAMRPRRGGEVDDPAGPVHEIEAMGEPVTERLPMEGARP